MARLASLREVRRHVIRIVRAVVIRHVALITCAAGQVVVVVDVALRTLQVRVASGQWKSNRVVIEGRRLPRRCAVAHLAGLRKIRRHMIGTRRLLIIRKMASNAGCGRALKVVPGVTRIAGECGVHAGQCEARVLQVIEAHSKPVVELMALLAGRREPGSGVAGTSGRLKISCMT